VGQNYMHFEAVIAKMTGHHIIRVPVVRDGKLVGVIVRAGPA
jgi:CBS domain-containing protein